MNPKYLITTFILLLALSLSAQQQMEKSTRNDEKHQVPGEELSVDLRQLQAELDQLAAECKPNPSVITTVLEPDPRDKNLNIPEGANTGAPRDAQPVAEDELDRSHPDPTTFQPLKHEKDEQQPDQFGHKQELPAESGVKASRYTHGPKTQPVPGKSDQVINYRSLKGPKSQPDGEKKPE